MENGAPIKQIPNDGKEDSDESSLEQVKKRGKLDSPPEFNSIFDSPIQNSVASDKPAPPPLRGGEPGTAKVEKPNVAAVTEATPNSVAGKNVVSPAGDRHIELGPKVFQQQPADATPSNAKITPEAGPVKTGVTAQGDVPGRVNQSAGAQIAATGEQTPVKSLPVEAKANEGGRPVTDATGGYKNVVAQNIEPAVQPIKSTVTNPGDGPKTAADVFAARTTSSPIAPQNVGHQKVETSPVSVQTPRVSGDSQSANVSNPGLKQEGKPNASDIAPVVGVSQFKGEQTRADLSGAPTKLDPKSDVFSTQGTPIQSNRQDVAKGSESKFETGRPAEQAGSKDHAPFKDPKSAGVLTETFGQKTEAGSRVEPSSQLPGNKQDAISSGQKADQITRGIEGRVNEGAKQPSGAEGRLPSSSETAAAGGKQPSTIDGAPSGGRQPGIDGGGKPQGITDGAQSGIKPSGAADGAAGAGKQANVSEGSSSPVRQPLHEAGDKGSGGGGGSVTSEATRRIDAGTGAGGKSEGQPASGGMGGGSSAPVDRAPHKPFSVEDAGSTKGATGDVKGDAQPTKIATGDLKGDVAGAKGGEGAGGKVGEVAGGKAGEVVGGKAGDIAGVKGGSAAGAGPGTGPRFDTGEVRGTEPGARFDSGELKDGRSTGMQIGGKSGAGAGLQGTESGIVKGSDVSGTRGAVVGGQGIGGSSGGSASGSTGFGGLSDGGILGDKRQPSLMPDGVLNQGGKTGKAGEGVSGGGILGTDVPFALPGALSGKDGGGRQSDQIFTDKGKAEAAPVGKQDLVTAAGKADSVSGKGEAAGFGGKSEPGGSGGKGEAGGLSEKGAQPGDFKDKGQKADAGIPAAMAGQIGAGTAEVGGVLKSFAQSVLSDGRTAGQTGDGTPISKGVKDASKSPAVIDGSGKEVPPVRQDFAGPGKKTQILPTDQTPGVRVVGPGGVPLDASAKKIEPLAPGSAAFPGGANGIAAGGGEDGDSVPLEEFNLSEVDLLSEAGEVEEVKEIEESAEAKTEDEMHYELALGLQLYTSIAEAQYGAYYYCTKEGDTVENVSREIVGDVRCSPLVFSLNKEHIVASTEYGVHPFKVGVMVQLPTPRDLKEFFGNQT